MHLYETFEKPMIKILAQMEIEGIKIDNQFLKVLSKKFGNKIEKIQKEIFKLSKKEFNIASPKQLGEVLYEKLSKKEQIESFFSENKKVNNRLIKEELGIILEYPSYKEGYNQIINLNN